MHIVLRAGRPAVRGMLMLLLMTFGISGYVDPGYFNVGDVLGMLVFIGAFPMRSVFCRHVWWGLSSESLIRHSPIAVVSVVMRGAIRRCSGLLNADQRIFGTIAVLRARSLGFMVAPEVARCLP